MTDKNEITLENHPSTLTVNVPKMTDGVKTLVECEVAVNGALLPFFNVCTATSLATLKARAEAVGLASNGDKTQITARAHREYDHALGFLQTVEQWVNDAGGVPTVAAGKRGRPAGTTNKPPAPTYVIFDGTGAITATQAQFEAYCAAVGAGQTPKQAAKTAMSH